MPSHFVMENSVPFKCRIGGTSERICRLTGGVSGTWRVLPLRRRARGSAASLRRCYFARHRCARISEKTLFVSRGVSATIIDGQYVPTTAVPRKGIALVQPRIKWPTSPHLPKARCTSMI